MNKFDGKIFSTVVIVGACFETMLMLSGRTNSFFQWVLQTSQSRNHTIEMEDVEIKAAWSRLKLKRQS